MQIKKITGLVILLFIISSYTTVHKFYVSVTQIDYNESKKSVEIISRIFIDDFEKLLKERYDESIELMNKDEEKEKNIDYYINVYLAQKLKIEINGKPIKYTFLGKQYDNDIMLCYLEIEGINSFDEITIENKVLMEVFEEQQNIIHVKKGKTRKSLILERENDRGLLNFSK